MKILLLDKRKRGFIIMGLIVANKDFEKLFGTTRTEYFRGNYLTFTALEEGTFTLTIPKGLGITYLKSISYSIDNGETWVTTQNKNNTKIEITTPTIAAGSEVLWKGEGNVLATNSDHSIFTSTGKFNVYGNIMSLLYEDDFIDKKTLSNSLCFRGLFEKNNNIINAEYLSLPATTLAQNCYNSMFLACTSLTTAPELPATTLAENCYFNMFSGCTSLTTAPSLPATTLATSCYGSMFNSCTSLTTAPELPATTLARSCYGAMFKDCSSLTVAPELPATTLANNVSATSSGCYQAMFSGCTSLIKAPELPATTLETNGYYQMFYGCTSLIKAPKLPATTLAVRCYYAMFGNTNVLPDTSNIDFTSSTLVNTSGLQGLFAGTKVTDNDLMQILPKDENNHYCLPVTSLTTDSCYSNMFYGCTSLTTAPELPATTLATFCYTNMFLDCTSLTTAPSILPALTLPQGCYNKMFSGCSSLVTAPELPATVLSNDCYIEMFKGCTSLNYIKMLGKNIAVNSSNEPCLKNWVQGVAATGTFIKHQYASWNVTGVNGIPTGWTVEYYTEPVPQLLMTLYVDKFPPQTVEEDDGGVDYEAEGYTREEYIEAEVAAAGVDPDDNWMFDVYEYYGDTLEYDGDTYYVCDGKVDSGVESMQLLLTTDDYDTLLSESIAESGNDTQFTSLVYVFSGGNEYDDNLFTPNRQLLKIIQNEG